MMRYVYRQRFMPLIASWLAAILLGRRSAAVQPVLMLCICTGGAGGRI